jgi:hypothetical protein
MILGMELTLLYVGFYSLVTGRMPTFGIPPKYRVPGWIVRIVGVVSLLPIPLSMATGIAVSIQMASQGKDFSDNSYFWVRTGLEAGIVLVCGIAIFALLRACRTPIHPEQADGGLASHESVHPGPPVDG